MVGSEERFFNTWLSNAFCMSHTWILDPGYHFFFCVWIFVFIVNGARTSSILEDRRGVGFFGWICFQPQFQPKFSGGISSSIAHRQFHSPPSKLAPSALAALVASSLHRARRPRAVMEVPPTSMTQPHTLQGTGKRLGTIEERWARFYFRPSTWSKFLKCRDIVFEAP